MNSSKSFWDLLFGNYEEPSLGDRELTEDERKAMKLDNYDYWSFEEEDLEEDDYYAEDDDFETSSGKTSSENFFDDDDEEWKLL